MRGNGRSPLEAVDLGKGPLSSLKPGLGTAPAAPNPLAGVHLPGSALPSGLQAVP